MAFISFNYNKNLMYAIIFWGLEIIYRCFIYFQFSNFRIVTDYAINEYIYLIIFNTSDLLAGFLALYINYSSKKKKIHNQDDDTESSMSKITTSVEFVSVKEKYFTRKSFILKMIIIIFLHYSANLSSFIFFSIFKDATYENIFHKAKADIINHFDIIIRYIFSYLLLETKMFKHHKFSIIIILIGFVILAPTDFISMYLFPQGEINPKYTYIYIGVNLLRGVLFPLEDTFVKKIFTEDYIIPEFCMFLRGVGQLILIAIITPILYFTVWEVNIHIEYNKGIIALVIILYFLSSFIKEYLINKVIYYFSSQSVSFLIISESITTSILEIILYLKNVESETDNKKFIKYLFFIIELIVILNTTFGTLVFDEIIVIKKCGLNLNVAKEISLRARSEILSISNLEDDDEVTIGGAEDDDNEDTDNTEESKLDILPLSVVDQ